MAAIAMFIFIIVLAITTFVFFSIYDKREAKRRKPKTT